MKMWMILNKTSDCDCKLPAVKFALMLFIISKWLFINLHALRDNLYIYIYMYMCIVCCGFLVNFIFSQREF